MNHATNNNSILAYISPLRSIDQYYLPILINESRNVDDLPSLLVDNGHVVLLFVITRPLVKVCVQIVVVVADHDRLVLNVLSSEVVWEALAVGDVNELVVRCCGRVLVEADFDGHVCGDL